ncbi:MAG: DUF1989 domain-containing protein [Gammaproteobacteria bacterium]
MLLLKHPPPGPPPNDFELEVPPDVAKVFRVVRGQLLSISDPCGGKTAALFAFTGADDREFLSPHHTRVFTNTFVLNLGMRLMTNRRRPIFVLGKDTVGKHDLLMPASSTAYLAEHGMSGRTGVVESVREALRDAGLSPPKIPDPVNLFAHVEVCGDGNLVPLVAASLAGGRVTLRVLIDSTCVVSAAPFGLFPEEPNTPIAVRVHEKL